MQIKASTDKKCSISLCPNYIINCREVTTLSLIEESDLKLILCITDKTPRSRYILNNTLNSRFRSEVKAC